MSFGIKNVEQLTSNWSIRCLQTKLEKIMEVYVDDLLVKISKTSEHVAHLKSIFNILWLYLMKFNHENIYSGSSRASF